MAAPDISVELYAAALAAAVESEVPRGERVRRRITGFSPLHDLFDANELYGVVESALGLSVVMDEAYFAFIAEAADLAFARFLNN